MGVMKVTHENPVPEEHTARYGELLVEMIGRKSNALKRFLTDYR